MKELWKKYSTITYRAFIILASILLMVYFMPREKYESIHYEEGKPWEHDQLIAEFDFKVMKAKKQIAAEQDSIRRSVIPYFVYSPAKNQQLQKALWESGMEFDHSAKIASKLDSIYKDYGIVSDKDASTIEKNKYNDYVCSSKDGILSSKPNIWELLSVSEIKTTLYRYIPEQYDTLPDPKGKIINAIDQHVIPNYAFDRHRTEETIDSIIGKINPVRKSIVAGQRIINNREIVDAEKFHTIEIYLDEVKKIDDNNEKKNSKMIFYGQLLFVIIIMASLAIYMRLYQRETFESNSKFTFTILSVTIFPILAGILLAIGSTSIYIIPFAIAPAMLCLFINSNIAVVAHMASILICSAMIGAPYQFIIIQLTGGISAILSLSELSSRSQMFKCTIATLLTYSLTYLCYIMIKEADISKMSNIMYFYFTISSILMLLIYPIMLIVEKVFGFVSSVTLIELSNFNNKLLQKLSQETPGTFQHSIQVGNLAAEAANAIGANSLEVRTGALYHDIGKTENPIYFTENQSGGISPHKALTPIESARVIIKHVTDGLAIAKREKLPKRIQEFITTHHGLSKTGYFYITYKNAHPDENVDDKLFTYPGPQPHTKEQAILSMADCVEAASHSLKEYTEENINNLVDNIIDPKVKNGEFSLSPLTFQDIDNIKRVFKKRLMAIYHTRISYPTEKKKE